MEFAQWITDFYEENKDIADVHTFVDKLKTAPARELETDEVKGYLDTDEGKKLLQPELDRYHSKSLASWKEKNLSKLVQDELDKINPPETPQAKEMREMKQKLALMEEKDRVNGLKSSLMNTLSEKKLPTKIVDLLIGEDEESTQNKFNLFEEVFNSQVNALVEERIKGNGLDPKDKDYKPTPSITLEQINDMSEAEIAENQEAIDQYLSTL